MRTFGSVCIRTLKITINRHTDYKEICIFLCNIIYEKITVYINANFRSIGLTLLVSQKKKKVRKKKKGIRTLTSEIFPVLEFHQILEKLVTA